MWHYNKLFLLLIVWLFFLVNKLLVISEKYTRFIDMTRDSDYGNGRFTIRFRKTSECMMHSLYNQIKPKN